MKQHTPIIARLNVNALAAIAARTELAVAVADRKVKPLALAAGMPAEIWQELVSVWWSAFLERLLPEHYGDKTTLPVPTPTLPGSDERKAELSARQAAAVALWSPHDATWEGNDHLGRLLHKHPNGRNHMAAGPVQVEFAPKRDSERVVRAHVDDA